MTAMDPSNNPTLLNGSEWSGIASFHGAAVSTYYRNTTYANLAPALFVGLKATIGDSGAGGGSPAGAPGHLAVVVFGGTYQSQIPLPILSRGGIFSCHGTMPF
jgi:hypothetical protein